MRPRFDSVRLLPLLLLFAAATADAAWVGHDGAEPARPVVEARGAPSSLTVDVTVPGFDLTTVTIAGVEYCLPTVPGAVAVHERGLPELPVLSRHLRIPDRGRPVLRVVEERWEEIPAPPVAPSKGHLTRDVDPDDVAYVFGPAYERGGVWPATSYELTDPFIVRDVRGAGLRIRPVRWDADRGVLLVLRSARLEVTVSGVGVNERTPTVRRPDVRFRDLCDALFLNDVALKSTSVDRTGRMLVVCHDDFLADVQDFIDWKRLKGIDAELLPMSSTGGSAASIRSFVTSRYVEPEGLTFLVLVGDRAQVPTNVGSYEGADSDALYAMVDGDDLYPDLFVSRISGSTSDQIRTQVEKFLSYESQPDTGAAATWYRKAAGLASSEGSPPDTERADLLRDDLLAYGFTHVDRIYQPTGTAADIAAAVDEGRSLINYLGHGSGTSWSNPPFSVTDVAALNNGAKLPWILDVSCSNGDFDLDTCFAEAWLRAGTPAAPAGAVGMYSASTYTSWVPPTVMQAHAVDLLCAESETTLGALYYFGAMQVLDDYPGTGGEGHKLVEQYNVFGDCSLAVRTAEPTTLSADHRSRVILGEPTFEVDVPGVEGLTVCLSADGVIHGTAVSDASGHALVVFDTPVTSPGDVDLTVTGFNAVPYTAVLPAVEAATVTIAPTSLTAMVSADLTVTVFDSDGVTPLVGVEVWAEQYGYASASAVTDGSGVAVFAATAPYGPEVEVVGRLPGESYDLFREAVPVTAVPLAAPDLVVTTACGLSDAFAPGVEGTLHATVGESPVVLTAHLPGGALVSAADTVLTVVPETAGVVTGVIAVEGHDVYTETFAVEAVYGTLSGRVVSAGQPVAGSAVTCVDAQGAPAFSATTDSLGDYAAPAPLPVGFYDLRVELFGYTTDEQERLLCVGANVHDVELTPAPLGVVAGTVVEADTGAPLAAVLSFVLPDGTVHLEVVTDPADGSYTDELPYFAYEVKTTAAGHAPTTAALTVDAPAIVFDVVMEGALGDVLLFDDGASARRVPDRPGDGRAIAAAGYDAPADRSAATFRDDLENLGYAVVVDFPATADPAGWSAYDLLVVSCGANTATLADTTFRSALRSWCLGGGKLLIEGGEVGYDYRQDDDIKADVLHVASWNGDAGGSVSAGDPLHPVMTIPNAVSGPVAVEYLGFGYHDRLEPADDAAAAGIWTDYPSSASVIAYDPDADPTSGQTVFFTFNYEAMDAVARTDLLENAVSWLLPSTTGTASLSGTVLRSDGAATEPAVGAVVTLQPGGRTATSDASGGYLFDGLFAGSYDVSATEPGWSADAAAVELLDGETLTGVDLTIHQMTAVAECATPSAAIPDDDLDGIAVTVPVSGSQMNRVTSLRVYLDIAHEDVSDLVVALESPDGTTVPLFANDAGPDTALVGWAPGDLAIAGDLDDFVGDATAGVWVLHVADTSPTAVGVVNEICLELAYAAQTTALDDPPVVLSLAPPSPNPFNPSTTIRFAVPSAGPVELAVYDLAGRKVRTLVRESLRGGRHEATWHGRDDAGRAVGSGLYLCRLHTIDGVATTRLTMLK